MKSDVGDAGDTSVFRHCEGVLEKAPNTAKGARRIYVPLLTAVVVIVILSALRPSFVCVRREGERSGKGGGSTLSLMRVLLWGVTAALITAGLTHFQVFSPKKK